MLSRKVSVALVAMAIGVTGGALMMTPASASESKIGCNSLNTWKFTVNGAGIYLRESKNSTRLGLGYVGHRFCVDTRGDKDFVHGTNDATGVTGWVHVNSLSV